MVTQPMKKSFWNAFALTSLSVMMGIGIASLDLSGAMAQAIDCVAYRAELSTISQGGDPRAQEYLVAAQRQRAELERTREYYNQIGCTRSDMFQTPAECAPLRGHMRQMQANMNEMLSFADKLGGGPQIQARRRQLQAMLDRHCANVPSQSPGFLERIFGGQGASNQAGPSYPEHAIDPMIETAGDESLGGSQPVCVRLADGYFFPLGGRFSDRVQASQLCQAQCPASQTELFFMRQGGTIERAQSANGLPYSALPNARLYQKKRVAEASCVPPGQSWEQALQGAEMFMGRRESDIIVTAEKAYELSRPKASANKAKAEPKRAAIATPSPSDADEIADPASVPTASGESAGIGPGVVSDERTVSRMDGLSVMSTAPDGRQRRVRIVAPYLIPTPKTATSNQR